MATLVLTLYMQHTFCRDTIRASGKGYIFPLKYIPLASGYLHSPPATWAERRLLPAPHLTYPTHWHPGCPSPDIYTWHVPSMHLPDMPYTLPHAQAMRFGASRTACEQAVKIGFHMSARPNVVLRPIQRSAMR